MKKQAYNDGNIIGYISTCQFPVFLCSNSLEIVAGSPLFIKLSGMAQPSLHSFLSSGSIRRIEAAQKNHKNIAVNCAFKNENYILQVSWIALSPEKTDYMIGVLGSKSNYDEQKYIKNMSHISACTMQMSTPLQVMLNNVALIKKCIENNDISAISSYIEDMENNTYKIIRCSTNIKDATMVMSGQVPLCPDTVDISLLLNTIVREAKKQAQMKKISLSLIVPDDMVLLVCDYKYISKAFLNILSNSICFTGKRGLIDIVLTHTDEAVTVTFSDNGTGISDYDKERILLKEKVFDSKSPKLGLFLAYSFIERHCGSIVISDNRPVGTVITVTIPKNDIEILELGGDTMERIIGYFVELASIEMSTLN